MLSLVSLTTLAAFISMTGTSVLAAPHAGVVADMPVSKGVPFELVAAGKEVGKLEKRTDGGVYICTDSDWSGQCGYAVQPLATCIGLDWPWYHSISSFGPDQGTVCDFYSDYECNDAILKPGLGAPGEGDLSDLNCGGGSCNDAIGGFMCYA